MHKTHEPKPKRGNENTMTIAAHGGCRMKARVRHLQSKAMQGTARHGTPGKLKPGKAKPGQPTPLQARPGLSRSWRVFAPKTGGLFQASHTRLSKHGAFLRRKVAVGGWFRSIHPQKPPPLFGTKCCRVLCCGRHAAAFDTHSFAQSGCG